MEYSQPDYKPGGARPTTCLSVEPHDDNVADHVTHYFGCVEFRQSETFFKNAGSSIQSAIKTELRRVDYLRQLIEQADSTEFNSLVRELRASHKHWRSKSSGKLKDASGQPERGLAKELYNPNVPKPIETTDYNPDKDLKAYVISFWDGRGVTDLTSHPEQSNDQMCLGTFPNQKIPVHDLLRRNESPLNKSYREMVREPGSTKSAPFPSESRVRYFHLPSNNMKWVQEAIAKYYGDPALYDTAYSQTKDRTRANTILHRDFWLHPNQGEEDVPSNIVLFMPYLHWELDRQRKTFSSLIERRLHSHFEALKAEEERQKKKRQKEQNEKWQKKRDKSHHLPTQDLNGQSPTDPVTIRQRSDVGGIFQRHLTEPSINGSGSFGDVANKLSREQLPRRREFQKRQLARGKYDRLKIENPLGQLLYNAVKLFEAMDNFRDRRLMDDYLTGNPPLHPRRTLDQAYYRSLRNTKTRDRDQVVYRGTSARPEELHHYDPEAKEWDCAQHDFMAVRPQKGSAPKEPPKKSMESMNRFSSQISQIYERSRAIIHPHSSRILTSDSPKDDEEAVVQRVQSNSMEHHERVHENQKEKPRHRECPGCKEAIRKLPQLVMVDQLWMWILDDETIITCFPRRYGVNRKDGSGVAKAIRKRLDNLGTIKIHSACDLALIIIDECCKVFFDLTKTDERKPQVLDIFSEAIGKIAQKKTMYFDHLWHWADELAKASTKGSSWVDLSSLHMALLNITPEGQLQRETKDIIEELDIMIQIVKKQQDVLKRFKRHAETLLKRNSKMGKKKKPRTFGTQASALVEEIEVYLEELKNLHRSAADLCRDIDHLLSMKQQQASVVQAWQAIRHGGEAVKQGKAIMIFTVMTIVFLPLAFMAAIFGMNNDVMGGDKMELSQQLKLIFSASVGVIVVIIIIAFSSLFRSLWWCTTYFCVNWLLVHLGLYRLWLEIPDRFRPEYLISWSEKQVDAMKSKERKQFRQEMAKKLSQEREKQEHEKQEREKREPASDGTETGPHEDDYTLNANGLPQNIPTGRGDTTRASGKRVSHQPREPHAHLVETTSPRDR